MPEFMAHAPEANWRLSPDEVVALQSFLEKLSNGIEITQEQVAQADQDTWKDIHCLECAQCCKTFTPRYTDEDITRISNFLKIEESDFKKAYLLQYTNGEWVNLAVPCSFLEKDNRCSIYAVRPTCCAGFPYHNLAAIQERPDRLQRNLKTCPASVRFLQNLKNSLEQ